MKANPVCPKTGVPMHRGVRPMTLTYKAESITFEMPGWYCGECEESVHTGKDMQVSDRRLNRLKALGEGLLTPENIRRIRQKLRLSQEAAGLLIGGGPRAFQKYESGDLLPSRAISSALVLLDHDPDGLAVLKEWQDASQRIVVASSGSFSPRANLRSGAKCSKASDKIFISCRITSSELRCCSRDRTISSQSSLRPYSFG